MGETREKEMADAAAKANTPTRAVAGWGVWLFLGTLVVLLVFFWWLLIYSHGVVVHHG